MPENLVPLQQEWAPMKGSSSRQDGDGRPGCQIGSGEKTTISMRMIRVNRPPTKGLPTGQQEFH